MSDAIRRAFFICSSVAIVLVLAVFPTVARLPDADATRNELFDSGSGERRDLPGTRMSAVSADEYERERDARIRRRLGQSDGQAAPAGATDHANRKPVASSDRSGVPKSVVKPLLESLRNGQTVVVPPGVYGEAAAIRASNVVIKAHGVRLENTAIEGKAALVVKGNNVTIEGLECAGIQVPDGNGACVRLEARDLTLRKVRFRDSQSGLMSWNRDSGTVLIEDSRFEGIGRAHGVYIGRGPGHLIIRNSWILSSTAEGHEIKSRAAKNTIEHSVIASLDGLDSRLIDLPEGGENIIRRNVLQKGPASSNQDLIGVGMEGQRGLHAQNSTVIEDNTIIMERPEGNVLSHHRHVPAPRIERNKVVGGPPPGGSNTWFPNRAAAALGEYPALPRAH